MPLFLWAFLVAVVYIALMVLPGMSWGTPAADVVLTPHPLRYVPQGALERLGPQLRELVEAQSRVDRRLPLPTLDTDFELTYLGPEPEILEINDVLANSGSSAILTVVDRPELVLKYQVSCWNWDRVHPLVRDYIFLKSLATLGVVPRVYYLSPPVRMLAAPSLKTRFRMSLHDRHMCARQPGAAVRFMVMERVIGSAWPLTQHEGSLGDSLTFIICALESIRIIHDRGIVHGDVHVGNIALMLGRQRSTKIGFLDFGLAFIADEMEHKPDMRSAPMTENHCYFSHWNIEGFRFSYRDDVFKILMVGAWIINGPAWRAHCYALELDAGAMVAWKRKGYLFQVPGGWNTFAAYPRDVRYEIHEHLRTTLDLARSVDELDGRPPYSRMIAALTAARLLTRRE